jgi:hypothetical protein
MKMTIKTRIRGGRLATNRNASVALKVATQLKGGRLATNRNLSVR